MAHLNPAGIDWVVSAFIVCRDRVLLIKHVKLGCWLGVGGHIEADETPDEALVREIEEETGLLWGRVYPMVRPTAEMEQAKGHNRVAQLTPHAVEVHDYPPVPGHRHACLVYLLHSTTEEVKESEEGALRWFTDEEIEAMSELLPSIRLYARLALAEARA